jgi:predicted O-methyltransferase YrrM
MSSLMFDRVRDRIHLKRMEQQTVVRADDWEGYYQVIKEFTPRTLPYKIYVNQLWPEWKRLMEFLSEGQSPKRILEIGTGRGGSTYFLTKLGGKGSLIVTVDADPRAKEAVALFGKHRRQKVHSVIGSSHDPATVERVASILGGKPVDLLYIDGDHSYDGVKKDFDLYKKFCGPESIVCFHDIIADYGATKGIQTDIQTGEVYKFWGELKTQHRHLEIVESFDQNGFGIGVIYLSTLTPPMKESHAVERGA